MLVNLLDTVEAVEHETEILLGVSLNSSFSATIPHLQIAHDSTSIKAGKKCWRNYYYSIVLGHSLSGTGLNPHLFFGTLFHAGTELYTKLVIGNWDWKLYRQLRKTGLEEKFLRSIRSGIGHDDAILVVVRWLLYYSFDHKNKSPWISTEPTKSLKTLLRTTIWYLDYFKDEKLETLTLENGKPAVELSFRFPLNDLLEDEDFLAPSGEEYLLCGHMDRVVRIGSLIYVLDKKTTKYALDDNYFEQYSPDVQMTLYSLAAQVIFPDEVGGIIVDGCQVLVNGTRFRRREALRVPEHFEEFLKSFKRYIRELEENVRLNDWPMNETACGFGYMQCQFRPVCSADPASRPEILENFYPKRIWDPLIPR
jgi:hypothetical protein